jgi:hypothetical protein
MPLQVIVLIESQAALEVGPLRRRGPPSTAGTSIAQPLIDSHFLLHSSAANVAKAFV